MYDVCVRMSGHHIQCAPKPGAKIRSAADIAGYNLLKPADRELIAAILFDAASDQAPRKGPTSIADVDDDATMQQQTAKQFADVVIAKAAFVMPAPGQNGARAGQLAGKTVVLTGIFPEAGYVGERPGERPATRTPLAKSAARPRQNVTIAESCASRVFYAELKQAAGSGLPFSSARAQLESLRFSKRYREFRDTFNLGCLSCSCRGGSGLELGKAKVKAARVICICVLSLYA